MKIQSLQMTEVSGIRFWTTCIVMLFSMAWSINMSSQTVSDADANPYPDYMEDVFMDMDFTQNIMTPEVPGSVQKAISSYQKKVADKLKKQFTIDMMRENDVFVICVPTDDLFLPNDTLFSIYAESSLNPVLGLMKDPYMYKIVVAVHTDDTGSDQYRESLSMARLATVYDWMLDAIDAGKISEDLVIVPYSMSSSEPLVGNDTREHRRQNRRLEFYFIPGPKMIQMAQDHKLK